MSLRLLAVVFVVGGLSIAASGFRGSAESPAVPADGQFGEWVTYRAASSHPGVAEVWGSAASRPKTSEITVVYTNFPESPARQAVEHAVEIMERQVTTDVEIIVEFSWLSLSEPTLARERSRWNLKDAVDDPDLPRAGVYYPATLANDLRGHRLDSEPDVEVQLNKDADWHASADGRPPAGTFDLVTVVLHELLQSYGISSELTSPGFAVLGIPTVFDLFVVGPDGTPLYEQDLATIRNEITGGEVRFTGPAARVAAGGQGPLLYTPAQLDPSSSVSHLDLYYADADPDSIMAPYIFGGWAIHDPGPITLAMLKDIGWDISGLGTATRLRITTQQPGLVLTGRALPQPIRVAVQDPVGVNVRDGADIQVSLDIYGSWDPGASISCPGGRVKATDQGVAAWDGCTPTGPWKHMYFRATSPGLADGMAHIFALTATIHRALVPGLARTR